MLLEHGYDAGRDEHFLRAIGGGIDFGERAEDALAREWAEEYRLTPAAPRLIGVLENIHEYERLPGHEIAFVFAATIAEGWAYARDTIEAVDSDGAPHRAEWTGLAAVKAGSTPCYPPGLVALADAEVARGVAEDRRQY